MPIDVVCPSCQRRLRVPDKVAGKKIKCPKCSGILPVPGPGSSVGSGVVGRSAPGGGGPGSSVAAKAKWYLKTPDNAQYGPVPKQELDQWLAEGRITPQCQLLPEGSGQWQWAAQVYPQLAGAAAASASATAIVEPASEQVSAENPFAGLTQARSEVAAAAPSASDTNDPFSFAGAASSPAARIRGGRRKAAGKRRGASAAGRSGAVTAVAVVNYVFGGLGVLGGALIAVLGATVIGMLTGAVQNEIAQAADGQTAEASQALGIFGAIGTAVFVGVGIAMILSSSVMILAGYGVQMRAPWGRILTLVLGGLQVLVGLLSLAAFSPTAIGNIGYAVFVFVVLLNKKYAAEFG